MRSPTPKTTAVECSVCGLDWHRHEQKAKTAKRKAVNLDDCVALLQEDLATERQRTAPVIQPQPYPIPYPVPWRPYVPNPYPWRQPPPFWVSSPTTTAGTGTTGNVSASTSSLTQLRGIPLNSGDHVGRIL